jgi:hypothetical protein
MGVYWAETGWGGGAVGGGGVVVPENGGVEEVNGCTTGAKGTSAGEAIDVGEGGAVLRGTAVCG